MRLLVAIVTGGCWTSPPPREPQPIVLATPTYAPRAERTGWHAFDFRSDRAHSECGGGLRYVKRHDGIDKWVGVELCSATRYKIFVGEDRGSVFHEVADFAGHGQDHCELVSPNFTIPDEDDITSGGCATCAVKMAGWNNPGPVPVYMRHRFGEVLELKPWPKYNLYTSVWYECGVEIP